MRVVCSYCRRTIRADSSALVTEVSHGMCEGCAAHFSRLWAGMPLDEYLEGLGRPVLLVDGTGRVIAMNRQLAELIGTEPKRGVGLLAGEAFACVYSRLPEGCGRTFHCRECAVRRAVETVARTGEPVGNALAYLDTALGRIDLRLSARPTRAGVVKVTIEEMGEPRPLPVQD